MADKTHAIVCAETGKLVRGPFSLKGIRKSLNAVIEKDIQEKCLYSDDLDYQLYCAWALNKKFKEDPGLMYNYASRESVEKLIEVIEQSNKAFRIAEVSVSIQTK